MLRHSAPTGASVHCDHHREHAEGLGPDDGSNDNGSGHDDVLRSILSWVGVGAADAGDAAAHGGRDLAQREHAFGVGCAVAVGAGRGVAVEARGPLGVVVVPGAAPAREVQLDLVLLVAGLVDARVVVGREEHVCRLQVSVAGVGESIISQAERVEHGFINLVFIQYFFHTVIVLD